MTDFREEIASDFKDSGIYGGSLAVLFVVTVPLLPFMIVRYFGGPDWLVGLLLLLAIPVLLMGIGYWIWERGMAMERRMEADRSDADSCPICSAALPAFDSDAASDGQRFRGWVCAECGAHIDEYGTLIQR